MLPGIILSIIAIILIIITIIRNKNITEINHQVEKELNSLLFETNKLKTEKEQLNTEVNKIKTDYKEWQNQFDEQKDRQLDALKKGYENYVQILEDEYEKRDNSFDERVIQLENKYNQKKEEIQKDYKIIKEELESLKATRIAAIEAQNKEKEISENKEFYCLSVSVSDINDIQVLERVKKQLNKPRVLSMLIWSTYFQKPMTALCNNVLGVKTVTGIYKITNQLNGMCYIGQSVDISKRWKDHAKCGLGIDAPAGNKLYKAMIEEGIWNFSWELLEECPKEKLDKKEKFYIDLYDSKNFGYNIIKGNK